MNHEQSNKKESTWEETVIKYETNLSLVVKSLNDVSNSLDKLIELRDSLTSLAGGCLEFQEVHESIRKSNEQFIEVMNQSIRLLVMSNVELLKKNEDSGRTTDAWDLHREVERYKTLLKNPKVGLMLAEQVMMLTERVFLEVVVNQRRLDKGIPNRDAREVPRV